MHETFGLRDLTALPWWILAFWGLGILAVSTAVVSLFFALGRRPGKAWASEIPPVASRDFLVGISGLVNSPLETGGTVKLLNNGDEFFPAILDAMRKARKTINFSVYIWEPGKASDMVLEVMTEPRPGRRRGARAAGRPRLHARPEGGVRGLEGRGRPGGAVPARSAWGG